MKRSPAQKSVEAFTCASLERETPPTGNLEMLRMSQYPIKDKNFPIFLTYTTRVKEAARQETVLPNVLLRRIVTKPHAREKCGFVVYVTDKMNRSD
jgi:hypothetical protein